MCGKYICEEEVGGKWELVTGDKGQVTGNRLLVWRIIIALLSLVPKAFSAFRERVIEPVSDSSFGKFVSGYAGRGVSSFASFMAGGGLLCLFSFVLLFTGILFFFSILVYPQQFNPPYNPQMQQPGNRFSPNAFKQEVAKIEAIVEREGKAPLSLTQVPRVQAGDVIKVRLSDEAVGGIKPDQSMYDWSLSIAFVNPNRNKDDKSSVSREVRFRKDGWYKQHAFPVPYDSQPIIFLYPKPNYRAKIQKLVSRKYEDIKKLGEKTIDIAGAYAQVGMFLNELQGVLNGYSGGYGGYGSSYGGSYGGYTGSFNTYNPYGNTYGGYGNTNTGFPINYNFIMQQSVERLARSFNIQLPDCWRSGGTAFGGYNNQNSFGYGLSSDMVGRVQCVAKQVRLEDLDLSISRMLQQGGIFAAAQLAQKYPQIAYWINIAALAIDMILKITRKTPLRIVPTLASSPDLMNGGQNNQFNPYQQQYQQPYQQPGQYAGAGGAAAMQQPVPKISIMAESQPNDNEFVTAYPVVLHKWQSDADPDVIGLAPPVLLEPCLHQGQNILKNTSLSEDPSADSFTRDFTLQLTSPNGFKKEFPLRKNLGLGGWELNLTREDLNSFPKIQMDIDAAIVGTRGFNDVKSPQFKLPIAIESQWEVKRESQAAFSVGGRRKVTLRNNIGNCRCLQAVIYKPSFGGQFVFEANGSTNNGNNGSSINNGLEFSVDGKEVSFEVDAASFQPGQGTLELRTYGGEVANVQIKLYPLPPNITEVKAARGDNFAKIVGERLEQLDYVVINGKKANVVGKAVGSSQYSVAGSQYQNQQYGQPNQQYGQPQYNQQNNQQYQQPGAYPNQGYPNQQPQQYPQPNAFPNQQSQPGTYANQYTAQNPNQGYGQPQGNVPNPSPITHHLSLSTLSPNERIVLFEEPDAKILSNQVTLELGLEDDRRVPFEKTFPVSPSRPAIAANQNREIEAIPVMENGKLIMDNGNQSVQSQKSGVGSKGAKVEDPSPKTRIQASSLSTFHFPFSIKDVLPVETKNLTLSIQNVLTDHDFKVENLSIETRVENSQSYQMELPRVSFEVLDWRNIRIDMELGENVQKNLGGRRLQFRIRDRERGDSDWYTNKQTFIRQAIIKSIRCTNQMNGMCEMKGDGIDYIQQVSIDGGQTWYPQEPQTLQPQPTPDGQKMVMIPNLVNKKFFRMKLRDYPKQEITQQNFVLSNTWKGTTKNASPNIQQSYMPQQQPATEPQNPPAGAVPTNGNRTPTIKPVKNRKGKVKR